MIPYGRQDIDQNDIDAVVSVLQSDYLTQGPQVPAFEQALAQRVGAAHAVAVNSATSALHIACLALGLGAGDWLWTSPITFVASANCALYCGARVDFVDIDPRSYTLCPEALEAKLKVAEREGRLPKIVVPVHFAGQACNMQAIHDLAQCYGFSIIEDASHAIGGYYAQRPIGQCALSDITVFSFHPVKIMTCAEGGVATCQDAQLAQTLRELRSHGVTRDAARMEGEPPQGWEYQQQSLGFNYRLSELHAALGLSQLARLEQFVEARQAVATRYDAALSELPLVRPWQNPAGRSAWHLYVVQVSDRAQVYSAMQAQGIGVNVHYIPVHTQPYYRRMGFEVGMFPEAERFYSRALSLPLYPGLGEEQDTVIASLQRALSRATEMHVSVAI